MDATWTQTLSEKVQPRLQQAMQSILNKEVQLQINHAGVLPIASVHSQIESHETVTTVYLPIMGDVIGDIFLILHGIAAQQVADLMIGNPLGTTQLIGEFEASALKEMGNITTGVIVTEMANFLNISMVLTIPNLATDIFGALIDQVLIEYGAEADELLAIQFKFSIDDIGLLGQFLVFFDKQTSEKIKEKLVVT